MNPKLIRFATAAARRRLACDMEETSRLIRRLERATSPRLRALLVSTIDVRLAKEASDLEDLGYHRLARRVRAALSPPRWDPWPDEPRPRLILAMLVPQRYRRTVAIGRRFRERGDRDGRGGRRWGATTPSPES